MNVLIVDDDINSAKVLEYALQYFDCALIKEAINGNEALDLIKTESFDIVFMDVNMPIMNGIEATTLIRGFNSSVFIVATSSDFSQTTVHSMLKAGANDYIYKPYISNLLRHRIANYFKLIENKKEAISSNRPVNIFNVACKSSFSVFKISNVEDICAIDEYLSKFYINASKSVSDAFGAIKKVSATMLGLKHKHIVFIEHGIFAEYLTVVGVRELNRRVLFEIIDSELHTKDTRCVINGNKLSIEFNLVDSDILDVVAQKNDTLSSEPIIFDFIEKDDLQELKDYLNDMESSLITLQYSALTKTEVLYLSETISKISTILGRYNQTYNIAVMLKSLSFDIKDCVDTFIENSKSLSKIFINFGADMIDWQKALFEIGAISANFMDDSIIVNCESISKMLKLEEETQKNDDLDDVFLF